MDTYEFLSKILPPTGIVVLAEPKTLVVDGKRKSVWRHFKYNNIDEAASAATLLDSKGVTIYHACSTFRESREKRMRTQDNAAWQKSFWVDADCGSEEGKYKTQRDAVVAIHTLCKKTALPIPTIVNSGGGIHAYWTLTEAVESAVWTPIARQFKAFLTAHGFLQDTSRTSDCASVLRPVGTHNRKKLQPRAVALVHEGEDTAVEAFVELIGAELPSADVMPDTDNDDLGGGIEYPASSAHRLVMFCETMKHVADVRGDVSEPLWRNFIGVLKFTIEGEGICHEWSAGHPDYDEYSTQQKIENWNARPATCESFKQTAGNKCEGCARTCKSPIQLGYMDHEAVPEAVAQSAAFGSGDDDEAPPVTRSTRFPKGFRVLNGQLCKMVKEGTEEDAPLRPIPFCDVLFYPLERIRSEDMTWAMRMEMVTPTNKRRQFLIPTQYMVEPQSLVSEMAKHEVFVFGKKGRDYAMDYYRDYIKIVAEAGPELFTYGSFGWTDAGDGFVLGSKEVKETSEQDILVSENVSKLHLNGEWVAGSRDEWVSLVDQIYNRPGAEAYQFIFLAALASPLIAVAGIDNFHGIPVALTGPTSLGKSTTCKMACSVFGKSGDMFQDASPQGSTVNGLFARASIQRHLPLVMDEMTKYDAKVFMDLLFSFSNGMSKIRLNSAGNLAGASFRWDMFTFITGNLDITEMLGTLDPMKAEASQVRCFEIKLPKDFNRKVFGDTNVAELIDSRLQNTYGHVGREYLKFIIRNKAKIRDMIFKVRAKYNPTNADESRERFYKDTIVLATVAGMVANKLGILRFDTAKTIAWANRQVKELRIIRRQTQLQDNEVVSSFLKSLHGCTLVTPTFPETRGGRFIPEAPIDPIRGEIIARHAVKDKKFYISLKGIYDWERENGVNHGRVLAYMLEQGMVKVSERTDKQGVRMVTLGQGTNIPTGRVRCIQLIYDVVIGQAGAGDTSNVIPLHGT